MKKEFLKIFGVVSSILSFFILDRFFKNLFLLRPTQNWQFLFFKFFLYKNEKILFGLLSFDFLTITFSLVILLYLIYLLIIFWRQKRNFLFFAASLILVGAASNLLDRFRYGFVIDYISWPLNFFNLADLMILAGVVMVLIKLVFGGKRG